ncbi:MAG: bacterial Ig-like domain-containing protein [Lachnospiraceae bacterium]|nr:bacterial Ig-like domain-containing protein [Lachnospiraceae bacterium]
MIHKALEELFDTILFFIGVFGVLIFFLGYWKNAFQIRYAEEVLRDFLGKIAITGKVTKEDYEWLHRNLYEIDSKYELKMQWVSYQEQPVYSLFRKEELTEYFYGRNSVKLPLLEEYHLPLLQSPEEELQMQMETNESVLAAVEKDYLPLPDENSELEIYAVRPLQEVYVNEKLITVCKVISSNAVYYTEAKDVVASEPGETELEVMVEGEVYKVPVQVICHPRTIQCENNHTITNEKDIIEMRKQTGTIVCPYCRVLPQEIFCETPEVTIKTGEELTGKKLRVRVVYKDGSTGYITPEAEEWQDNYDKEFCGEQMVTIRYRNAETQVAVTSQNDTCSQCGKECNDRCREDYFEYPYCLECLSQMYIFTGRVQIQENLIAGKELLSVLDTEQEVLFSRDDFVVLELKTGRSRTILQKKIAIDGRKGNGQ